MTMLKAISAPITPQGKPAMTMLPAPHYSGDRLATVRIRIEENAPEPSTLFNHPSTLSRHFPRLAAGQVSSIHEPVVGMIIRLLADADKALRSDRMAAKSYITQATTLLRAEYARRVVAGRHPPRPSSRSGLTPWQIVRVERYVEQNLHCAIKISALADVCRLSASYFAAAFKRSMGEPPHAYLTRRRVAQAQELMLATDRPLAHIAQDCGFCDQAHLSRIFRRSTGLPPNTWRRRWSPVPATDKLGNSVLATPHRARYDCAQLHPLTAHAAPRRRLASANNVST